MAKGNNGRDGRCYEFAFLHIMEMDEGILVHGEVYSYRLKRRIGHAWVITSTGPVYEPVLDRYFRREFIYDPETFAPKELATYTLEQAAVMVLKHKTYGPWDKKSLKIES